MSRKYGVKKDVIASKDQAVNITAMDHKVANNLTLS